MRLTHLATVGALLLIGVVCGLYGLLALTFTESGGTTYVTLGGHRLDAHRVGAVSLVIGLASLIAAIVLARRRA